MTAVFEPLLAFIRQPESRGDYNIVWGGIAPHDHPPRALTTMTIGEVLAWQDSIDARYRSEAAGAYQFMEDTLREIYPKAGCHENQVFNEVTQDRLATYLLRRRGLDRYMDGTLSLDGFCNNLAMEWASLPVVTATQGAKRWLTPGQSYYAGDGLNKSHVSVTAFKAAVRSLKDPEPVAPANPEKERNDAMLGGIGLGNMGLALRIGAWALGINLGVEGLAGTLGGLSNATGGLLSFSTDGSLLQLDIEAAKLLAGSLITGGAFAWRKKAAKDGGKL